MQSILTRDDLVALGRNRWMAPLLVDLAAYGGARFVELLHRLGLVRDSLARTLEAGCEAGWIQRNPGHGHPLRPEYILTTEGERLAQGAGRVLEASSKIGLEPGQLTRWGLPLIDAIADGHSRFNALARELAPATPRALAQGLRALVAEDLVRRTVLDSYPPTPEYRLSKSGARIARTFRIDAEA